MELVENQRRSRITGICEVADFDILREQLDVSTEHGIHQCKITCLGRGIEFQELVIGGAGRSIQVDQFPARRHRGGICRALQLIATDIEYSGIDSQRNHAHQTDQDQGREHNDIALTFSSNRPPNHDWVSAEKCDKNGYPPGRLTEQIFLRDWRYPADRLCG